MRPLAFFFFVIFWGCKNYDKAPLIPKDETSYAEKKNTLFVFVGEKIFVQEAAQDSNSMDAQFKAKYLILLRIYGTFLKDTIEFEVYDHYGIPGFSHYKNVLLFVSEFKGKYYHEKYQFFDVYPTEDGKWAGVHYIQDAYENVKPKKLPFRKDIFLPTTIINNNGEVIDMKFSEPYYKIIEDKAYPLYGFSIEELFAIKKNGVLKWRGLFGKGNENWIDSFLKTEMAELKMDSSK